eukprot:403371808
MIDTLDKSVEDIFQIQDHNQIEDPQTQNYDQQERPFIHLKFCGQNKATALGGSKTSIEMIQFSKKNLRKFTAGIVKFNTLKARDGLLFLWDHNMVPLCQ